MILLCTLLVIVYSENILVSVQSKSQQDMDLLTAKVDEDLQQAHGGLRQTLGAIEATMSRVVDVDSEYFVAPALSVPTWGMLQDIEFDNVTSTWTFVYNTMRAEPGTLNQFHRVLYMTKQGVAVNGDVDNECLQDGVDVTTCLQYLQEHYTVPETLNSQDQDYLTFSSPDNSDIQTVITGEDTSLTQTVTITIPHTRVRNGQNALAKLEEYTHPTLGTQRQWTFGIGVLFHGVGSNMIIFDTFNLIENSFEQLAISRTNTYSLARHVSFWTERVQYDTSIRVATVEYFLSPGYEIESVSAMLNEGEVTTAECNDMQAKLDLLTSKECIYARTLCTPHVLLTGDTGDLISYAIPLPERATGGFKVNTMLTLRDKDTGVEILSSLNFKTEAVPQDVCATAQMETFDPASHVAVGVYKGHSLEVVHIDGSFSIQNISDTAMGLPEALLTLVLAPKDDVADNYFLQFPDENINLDELYISHALQNSNLIPDSVNNTIVGLSDANGVNSGRSVVQLDPTLLANCPMESVVDYETAECVTTKDWSVSGGATRPKSTGGNVYYVHRVNFQIGGGDVQWLQDHSIFIDTTAATNFLASVEQLVPDATRRSDSQMYWIFPVYSWYDQSPIGLKDKALVSFAWSVSKAPVSSRRLLAYSPREKKEEEPSSVNKKVSMNRRKRKRLFLEPRSVKKVQKLSEKEVSLLHKIRSFF